MRASDFSKKTFSLIALISAACLPAAAGEDLSKDISDAASLRETLTATTPDASGEGIVATYDGYTLRITPAELLVPITPGAVSGSNPDGIILPAATHVVLAGNGSENTVLRSDGPGDLFGFGELDFSFSGLKVLGSGSGADDADGRVAILAFANVTVSGDTVFADRFFSANEKTSNASSGGIFYSSSSFDEIVLDTAAGDILFSRITTYGDTLSVQSSSGELVDSENAAAGGVIFLGGTLKVQGENSVNFAGNVAESEASDAFGGAIYVASSEEKPEDYGLKFGSGAHVGFSGNRAAGENAYGGAVVLAAGALEAQGAKLTFSGNTATARSGSASGGALQIAGSSRVNIDTHSVTEFAGNTAETLGECSTAAGGGVHLEAAELKASGNWAFSDNKAITSADGSSAFGGALAVAGEEALAEFTGADSVLEFSGNAVSASGKSKKKTLEENGTSTEKTYVPAAAGGAIAVIGGKFDVSGGAARFSGNTATVVSAGTLAQGGALYVGGNKTEAAFSSAKSWEFSGNSAIANGAGNASGGAVSSEAGNVKFDFSAALTFSRNTVEGTATGTDSVDVRGGAIAVNDGKQDYVMSGGSTLLFSENAARVSTETSGSFARGGAIALRGNAGELSISGKSRFAGNTATAIVTGGAATDGVLSSAQGGAVFSAGSLSLGDGTFAENSASASGESASAFGGAVYLSGGSLKAKGLTFLKNEAVATDLSGADLLGYARGGAIYQSSGTATLQSANFEQNRASGEIARGGAVYGGGMFSVAGNAEFLKNTVSASREASGGALYAAGTLSFGGNTCFTENEAVASGAGSVSRGGAIYLSGSLRIEGDSVELSGNKAVADGNETAAFGGAVYLKGGNLYLSNAKFSGNIATGTTAAGGAIYIDASGSGSTTLTLAGNTTIAGNTANGIADGIAVGIADAANATPAGDVSVKIASGATFSTSTDADGNEIVSREDFETVTLADPLRVSLEGADFNFEKTSDGGDFVWTGTNEISVAGIDENGTTRGGNFTLAFRSGKTTLAKGFSLAGTAAKQVEIDAGAELSIASGAAFCNFDSMAVDGTIASAGTLNFSDSSISVAPTGKFIFEDGAATSVSGKNVISGGVTIRGNTAFSATFPDGATEASLSMSELYVEKSGTTVFSGEDENAAFVVSAENIYFESSGTLVLGAGTKLLLNGLEAVNPETELAVEIAGSGTLVLLDKTEENDRIAFNAYYDAENKKSVASHFSVGGGIKIENGIFVSAGTTLDLGGRDYKNVVIDAGTLSASGSSAENPAMLETLDIKSSAVLGDGKTVQVIRLKDVTDDDGTTTPRRIALSGNLKIEKDTTLISGVNLQNYASAGLSGAGTLAGDVVGSGNLSIRKIDGNVSVNPLDRTSFSGTVFVGGNVSNTGRLTLKQDARLALGGTFKNEVAGQTTFENGTAFSGKIENAGTLTLAGITVMEAGGSFIQKDSGTLVLGSGAALNLAEIAGSADAVELAGTLIIDPADYAAGEEFTGLFGLRNGQLGSLTIRDAASNSLTDRIAWSDALGCYVFLGLNGRRIKTTLYGDLVRENVFRIYDFMRAGLMHGRTASIRPSVFGEEKKTSRYMLKYLERKNRFNTADDKPDVPAPVEESAPGEFGRTADALMNNVWVQTQYGHTNASTSGGHPDYAINAWGALIGTSIAAGGESEIGTVFGYNHSRMKHSGANAHKIDIDAYELMGFYRHVGKRYDGTLTLSGAYATNDSERGDAEADFNSWQLGALAEGGITFRPESWCEIRPFTAIQFAYSRTDSFRESGSDDAFRLDSASTLAARGSLGLGLAFLPADSVQISLKAAWNLDLGDSVADVDAYQRSTRSDVSLTSREAERSSFDLGAYLNYRLGDGVSVYTGYTGILRSGHEEHRADLGINFVF